MIKSSKLKQDKERKGYKFRLIVPNSDTECQLTKIVVSCRFVWNQALALVKQDDDSNSRNDFVHKVTTAISKSYAYVTVEALKVKNMSKSAKGTVAKHGKMVKQKSGLNKSILGVAT